MKTFIVVTAGAYGISFKVVRCLSASAALNMVCGNDNWYRSISHVIDVDQIIDQATHNFGIIYEQHPTG